MYLLGKFEDEFLFILVVVFFIIYNTGVRLKIILIKPKTAFQFIFILDPAYLFFATLVRKS